MSGAGSGHQGLGRAAQPDHDRVVRTVCSPNCSGACAINAFVKDDRLVKIEPGEFPDPRFNRICLKGIAMAMQRVHHPDRLTHPLRRSGERGADQWQRISWDEAFDTIAAKLRTIAEQYGPEANAWTTMTGNYGVKATTAPNRIANTLGGTWFTYLGLMGDCGCSMGYLPLLGVFNTSNEWSDLAGARLVILFARNLADTGHSEMHFLFDAMEAGAQLVVVDPRYSRTATKADLWISPRPGTDAALILGMLNVIVSEKLFDARYLERHTNAPFLVRTDSGALLRARDVFALSGAGAEPRGESGYVVWDPVSQLPAVAGSVTASLEFSGQLRLLDGNTVAVRSAFSIMAETWSAYTPGQAAEICEVPAQTIAGLARAYATTSPAAVWLGQGMQRYFHGHLAFRAAITLGALCGNIGKRHAGINWSDGAMFRLYFGLPRDWLTPGGKQGREMPGTRMLEQIASGSPYPVKSLWLAGYGFGTQSPNFDRFLREALPQLELFVITEQVMTPAAQWADIVLPCVSYYEDDMDLVPSAENLWLQLRRQAIPRVGESKDDWDIFAGVAQRLGHGEDWSMNGEEICQHLLAHATEDSVRAVDWAALKRDGVVRLGLPQPSVPFSDQRYPTPSGRIELYTEQLCEFGQAVAVYEEPLESQRRDRAVRFPFTLMTNHSVHSVHSQHTNLPWIREQLPGPLLDMHPLDAGKRKLADGELVEVYNDRGAFQVHLSVTAAVRPGSLNIPQGWWPRHFVKGHYNNVSQLTVNPAQDAIIETNFAVFDNLVDVRKVPGANDLSKEHS